MSLYLADTLRCNQSIQYNSNIWYCSQRSKHKGDHQAHISHDLGACPVLLWSQAGTIFGFGQRWENPTDWSVLAEDEDPLHEWETD